MREWLSICSCVIPQGAGGISYFRLFLDRKAERSVLLRIFPLCDAAVPRELLCVNHKPPTAGLKDLNLEQWRGPARMQEPTPPSAYHPQKAGAPTFLSSKVIRNLPVYC